MDHLARLRSHIEAVEELLTGIEPIEASDDERAGDYFERRELQGPALLAAAQRATEGLNEFPLSTPLLKLRCQAYLRIAEAGEFPYLEQAEQDLRSILTLDPDHIGAALQLLSAFFVYSGLEDDKVAAIAGELSAKTQGWLESLVGLQLEALGYADQLPAAEALHSHWSALFPESEAITSAWARIATFRADGPTDPDGEAT